MRCILEFLLPIRMYIRKRVQVGGVWAATTFLLALLVVALLDCGPFLCHLQLERMGKAPRRLFAPALLDEVFIHKLLISSPADGLIEIRTQFSAVHQLGYEIGLAGRPPASAGIFGHWLFAPRTSGQLALRHALFVVALIGGLLAVEFILALLFVRHRPSRQRPLCTWQTFKYVLMGSRTWALLVVGYVAAGLLLHGTLLAWRLEHWPRSVWQSTLIVLLVGVPVVLVGGVAAQAAAAVVALQDDRRCVKCGYFLIGLTEPRCPECGTEFDPKKLGVLAATQQEDGGP